DTLNGGNGNDTLNGGTGNDTMTGGAGNDAYFVDASSDKITESANQGTDTVYSSISLTLGSNVEDLVLTGTGAINGTGNTLDNSLSGNAGANSLGGGSGHDVLNGGAGNDKLTGGADQDIFVFAAGTNADQVLDFADTNAGSDDLLDFRAAGFTGPADVLDSVIASGNNLVIDLGGAQSVTIVNYMQTHTLGN